MPVELELELMGDEDLDALAMTDEDKTLGAVELPDPEGVLLESEEPGTELILKAEMTVETAGR